MKLSVELIKAENEYIARCPEIDVNCYGTDKDEAIKRLKNVILFYLDSVKEFGIEVSDFEVISDEDDNSNKFFEDTFPHKSESIN